jgi:serine phosphatase RsbU (regulator of sigma subunit)/HAMP domain-containing protein
MSEKSTPSSFISSIKGKLILSFGLFIFFLTLIFAIFFWLQSKENKIRDIADTLKDLNLKVQNASNFEKDFFIWETINEQFYESGESIYMSDHKASVNQVKEMLLKLKNDKDLGGEEISKDVELATDMINDFEMIFDSLVSSIKERGFKRYGLEGDMRSAMSEISSYGQKIDPLILSDAKNSEKDYIIQRDVRAADKLEDSMAKIDKEITDKVKDQKLQAILLKSLEKYWEAYEKLRIVDASIGYQGQPGLREILTKFSLEIEQHIQEIDRKVSERAEKLKQRLQTILVILFIAFVGVNALMGVFLFRSLSMPITKLSDSIHKIVESKFVHQNVYISENKDEIGLLSRNFKQMLEKVEERNNEVIAQKEKISEAYENMKVLREIGQEIGKHLTVDKIVEALVKNVGQLVDVSFLAVGILNQEKNGLHFKGEKANNEHLKPFSTPLDEKNRLEVHCFEAQKFIHSNTFAKDLQIQFKDYKPTFEEEKMGSVVYLPLTSKSNRIGILTVQSHLENTYEEFHLDLLRSLVAQVASAIENALTYENLEELVRIRTAEVVDQKKEIERRNIQLTSGINYASRIQNAILPDIQDIKQAFPESFVIFKPRDIVSGDFYWFGQVENRIIIAAIDCTGHGVPGAFMSMIGHEILNNIINIKGISQPNLILSEMHLAVYSSLKQDESENKDGMDLSLCVLDLDDYTLSYAGARNPLVFVRRTKDNQSEIFEIRGDKHPVGGKYKKEPDENREFTVHTIPLVGDNLLHTTFYIFSDGFQDQFGGGDNTKFYSRRFRNLLWAIADLPLAEQQKMLEKTHHDWMRDQFKQTDDILVIGFRLNAEIKNTISIEGGKTKSRLGMLKKLMNK